MTLTFDLVTLTLGQLQLTRITTQLIWLRLWHTYLAATNNLFGLNGCENQHKILDENTIFAPKTPSKQFHSVYFFHFCNQGRCSRIPVIEIPHYLKNAWHFLFYFIVYNLFVLTIKLICIIRRKTFLSHIFTYNE